MKAEQDKATPDAEEAPEEPAEAGGSVTKLSKESGVKADPKAKGGKGQPIASPDVEEEEKPVEVDKGQQMRDEYEKRFGALSRMTDQEIELEEFLAQVNFKRSIEIEGYSEVKIELTFTPYKQTSVAQQFTMFLANQDYSDPIPISITGRCVHVPIYVEHEEYNMHILVYEQWYRQRILLFNRSSNSMKV